MKKNGKMKKILALVSSWETGPWEKCDTLLTRVVTRCPWVDRSETPYPPKRLGGQRLLQDSTPAVMRAWVSSRDLRASDDERVLSGVPQLFQNVKADPTWRGLEVFDQIARGSWTVNGWLTLTSTPGHRLLEGRLVAGSMCCVELAA